MQKSAATEYLEYAALARPGRSFSFSHKGMPKPPTGGRGATRAVRLSFVLFALASLPPLLFVALTAVSPARFTVSVPNLSGWTRLLPAAWQPAARQEQQGAATAQWVGPAPAALPAVILGTSERGRLVYGDRLKITFFETLGVSLGDEAAKGDHLVATVFPRMDLSTEYMVDEAGAIDIYGGRDRLPQAISPHLTFWYWKPANLDATSLVTVGFNPGDIAFFCGTVTRAGTVRMPDSVANQEAGTPILVCTHLRESINAAWPSLRSFN